MIANDANGIKKFHPNLNELPLNTAYSSSKTKPVGDARLVFWQRGGL